MGTPTTQRRREDSVPASVDAERTVLANVLLNPDLIYDVRAALISDDFSLGSHKVLYGAMVALAEDSVPVDMVTLCNFLKSSGDLDKIGGSSYIAELTTGVPARQNVEHWTKILREKTSLRKIIDIARTSANKAVEQDVSSELIIADMESALREVAAEIRGIDQGPRPLYSFMDKVFDEIKTIREYKQEMIGLSYGLRNVDFTTTGMRKGETTVVGGRTGAGKSAFALGAALANAKHGVKVYYASAEMLGESLAGRSLSALAQVNNFKLRDPRHLTIEDMQLLSDARESTKSMPILVDQRAGSNPFSQTLSRARLAVRKYGCELLIFDFAQRMRAEGENRFDRVGNVADAVSDFARDEHVHCMLLSQIGRDAVKGKKEDHAPTMEDLKESGRLEDDADVVLLIWRRAKGGQFEGEDEIIIAKQRHGPVGSEKVSFDKETMTYKLRE